jgi:hypothetical protein
MCFFQEKSISQLVTQCMRERKTVSHPKSTKTKCEAFTKKRKSSASGTIAKMMERRKRSTIKVLVKFDRPRKRFPASNYFFTMLMTLKALVLKLHAARRKIFRQLHGEKLWKAHERSEARKKGAASKTRTAKIIFSFIRNSSKICNRNRDQKYVKFKRAEQQNWLTKKKKQENKSFPLKSSISFKTFKLLCFKFEICVV